MRVADDLNGQIAASVICFGWDQSIASEVIPFGDGEFRSISIRWRLNTGMQGPF
jgi:hypothetical protein